MSPASIRRLTRAFRHLCTACGARRARYRYSRCCARRSRSHPLFPLLSHRARPSNAPAWLARDGPQGASKEWRICGRMTNEIKVRQR